MTFPDLQLNSLHLDLGERSYDILIGQGLIQRGGQLMARHLENPRVVIITDENVARLHLKPLQESLCEAHVHVDCVTLPAGEKTKSFDQLAKLCEHLLEIKVERSTTLIALGGGVIGDLVGFAAAITLRGLPFIQVPTTVLSQVDSSVGGKTGINTDHGKNLVGAFYQPKLVVADLDALSTLDHRQILAGYAEIVKYGFIDDVDFFEWLETHGADLIKGDVKKRTHAVLTSCRAKARVVAKDERESGVRALLNLGHTFGHALEAQTGYGDALLHGEAVAIGTVMAFDLSHHLGLCSEQSSKRAIAHLKNVGLPTDLSNLKAFKWTVEDIMNHMSRDKKVKNGTLTFILTRGIGRSFISRDVEQKTLREWLAHWIQTHAG